MPGRNGQANEGYRYGFNGMEMDDEVSGNGNSYNFGARMYNPRVGRWFAVDPKMSKYPMDSPYMSFGNSPIIIIDPNGEEKIVIVGSESRKWNLTFILPGLKQARKYSRSRANGEDITILLFKAGYSDRQIDRIKKYAGKKGVQVIEVNSAEDVVNYLNNKTLSGPMSNRQYDPITDVSIFSHGFPSSIEFGYHQEEDGIQSKYSFGSDEVSRIDPKAFDSKCRIVSFACRTGAFNGNDDGNVSPEKSLAQQMANNWGVLVLALQRRSDYENILPDDPRNFISERIWKDETYNKNGGSWDSDSAINAVSLPTSGSTPSKSPGWTIFRKGKSPKTTSSKSVPRF